MSFLSLNKCANFQSNIYLKQSQPSLLINSISTMQKPFNQSTINPVVPSRGGLEVERTTKFNFLGCFAQRVCVCVCTLILSKNFCSTIVTHFAVGDFCKNVR